jgi:hypothetical protein
MGVHLFAGVGSMGGPRSGSRLCGYGPPLQGCLPLPATKLLIFGVTKDSAGAVLASCTVSLYRTLDDMLFEKVISDGSGNYAFSAIGLSEQYYVVAYKAGSPDVAGTTVNTLVGT